MIDAQLLRRYVKVTATITKLESARDAIRAQLLDALRRGEACPTTEPYIVLREVQIRKSLSWKGIAETLAERLRAVKALQRLVEEAPQSEVEVLRVRPNPEWKKPGER